MSPQSRGQRKKASVGQRCHHEARRWTEVLIAIDKPGTQLLNSTKADLIGAIDRNSGRSWIGFSLIRRANERVYFDPMSQLSDPFETVGIRDAIVDKLWRKMPI